MIPPIPPSPTSGKVNRTGDTLTGDMYSSSATVAAAGTTQGTATALTKQYNFVTSGIGGVILPAAAGSGLIYFVDNDTTNALNIYPPSGGFIDGGTPNVAKNVAAGKIVGFVSENTNEWITIFGSGAYIPSGVTLPTTGITDGQLFTHTPTGRSVWMKYNKSILSWVPLLNEGATVVYVDGVNGTDSQNNGYGTGTSAYKTIQYAVNQLAGTISGNVTINIAAGTYNEAITIFGKSFTGTYSISLVGATTQQTSGTSTGTNTTTTLNDTGKAWTVNAYVEKLVYITGGTGSGQLRLVKSNTATALTTYQKWDTTPDATSTYAVLSIATNGASITVNNGQKSISAQYMIFNKTDVVNIYVYSGGTISVTGCIANGATDSVLRASGAGSTITSNQVVAYSGPRCLIEGFGNITCNGTVIRNMTVQGVYGLAGGWFYPFEGNEIKNNGSHGVYLQINAILQNIPTTEAGRQNTYSGNGGWGVYADSGSQADGLSYAAFSGNVSGTYSGNATKYAFAG